MLFIHWQDVKKFQGTQSQRRKEILPVLSVLGMVFSLLL